VEGRRVQSRLRARNPGSVPYKQPNPWNRQSDNSFACFDINCRYCRVQAHLPLLFDEKTWSPSEITLSAPRSAPKPRYPLSGRSLLFLIFSPSQILSDHHRPRPSPPKREESKWRTRPNFQLARLSICACPQSSLQGSLLPSRVQSSRTSPTHPLARPRLLLPHRSKTSPRDR
jgi:hypothetical protein